MHIHFGKLHKPYLQKFFYLSLGICKLEYITFDQFFESLKVRFIVYFL
jgi:hypothetical protein